MVHTCYICKIRSDKSQGLSFHRFPSNSNSKQEWLDIILAGKSKKVPGKMATVCSSHFEPQCFRYGLINGKPFLKEEAKPTLNLKKQDSVPTNSLNTIDKSIIDMPDLSSHSSSTMAINERVQSNIGRLAISNKRGQETPLEVVFKKKIRLTDLTWEKLSKSTEGKILWETAKQELLYYQRSNKYLQRHNQRLKQKVSSLKLLTKHLFKKNLIMKNEAKVLHSTMDPVAEALFKRIISKKRNSKFPLGLRTFTSTLLFLSPKAYAYVRKILSFSLPHPSTVRKWMTTIDSKPGISKPALQVLKSKLLLAREKKKTLLCSVTVDDMAIRKHLHWNGKKYMGFVSDANDSDGKKKMATQAMVVMIVCLNEHWKIPMSYYLIDSLNGEERARCISQCLTNLHEIGINIVSLTFDGAPCNIRMVKKLGAEFNFTEKANIHFPHPVTKEPIFVIIDACHAIKLIRNTLAKRKVLYNREGNSIEWKYFEMLVRTQYKYGLHAGTKIKNVI